MSVPGTDAFVATIGVRGRDLGIAVLGSRGIVTDWGVQSAMVRYIARQHCSQLSIVLAGRGYFDLGGRIALLTSGDAVLSDQRRQGHEGYGGSPAQILLLDWEGDGALGPEHHGEPVVFRVAPRDVAYLRGIVARAPTTHPDVWARAVVEALRALGMPAPREGLADIELPRHVGALYRALAVVRSRLRENPDLADVAASIGISERHVRRAFEDLDRELRVGTNGWRDFIGDTRIGAAQQLLSVPGLPMERAARLAGFRSAVALCHALKERGGPSPGELARRVHERWEIRTSARDRDVLAVWVAPETG